MKLFSRALGLELTPGGWRAVQVRVGLLGTRVFGCAEGVLQGPQAEAVHETLREAARSLDAGPGTRLGIALARPLAHVKAVASSRAPRAAVIRTVTEQAAALFPTGAAPVAADICFVGRNGPWPSREMKSLVAVSAEEMSNALQSSADQLKLELRSLDLSATSVRGLIPPGSGSVILVHRAGFEWVGYKKNGQLAWSRYYPARSSNGADGSPHSTDRVGMPEALAQQIETRTAILTDADPEMPPGNGADDNRGKAARLPAPARGLAGWRYAVAYGAALQALGAQTLFDLRPLRRRVGSRVLRYLRRGVLLALLALSAALYAASGLFRLHSEVAGLERAIGALRPETERVMELRSTLRVTSERVEALHALEAAQPRLTTVLTEIGRVLPAAAYLTGFRTDVEFIRIEGYAAETPAVVGALHGSEMFRSVRLAGPVTQERTPEGDRQRFAIELLPARREAEAP